jgi:hypothetical protein
MNNENAVDFSEIMDSVESYDSPSGMTEPVAVNCDGDITRTMTELIYAIENRGVNSQKCAFYLHPVTLDCIWKETFPDISSPVYQYENRVIKTNCTMPKSSALFCAPDCITLGGKVINPLGVAYSTGLQVEKFNAE